MRKSISVTFFSMVATLLVLGTAVLGCSEWLLFSRYFAQERYDTLDSVARTQDFGCRRAAVVRTHNLQAETLYPRKIPLQGSVGLYGYGL